MKSNILAEPVLVGRQKELNELHVFLNSALEGKGNTVFVSGEAGSGKTRLTREFLNAARKRGVAVMAGWCLSDSAVPYFPFVEAFNTYYAASTEEQPNGFPQPEEPLGFGATSQIGYEEQEVTVLLTGPKPIDNLRKTEALSPQVWKDQAFATVARTLHLIAAHDPLVLFIEDIHWADSASLALLHYIARATKDTERVLVLATFRSEELTADAEGHPHPLAETLRMMQREELYTEIKLPSLNRDSVARIAENMIGGNLQQELVAKLAVEGRGNPLFVVESLRMLHERNSLVQENNEWRLATDELEIPAKIRNIILRRLTCLNYAQRRILDAASVIGEEFDVELLGTVLGQDTLAVLETLNVIAHSTSLVSVEGSSYKFDHARSRETLYEELSLPLKCGYHNRIAEKLESTKKATLPLSDLAFHYSQAENVEKAVKYALAAGQDALAKYSNKQAIKHFQYVLKTIVEGQFEEKNAALEGLGDAYAADSVYNEAIKVFDELAASASGATKLRAIRKAMDASFAKGDNPQLLIEYAKKAEDLGVDNHLEIARILDNRGKAWGWSNQGATEMDLADYDSALQVFEIENSLADAAEALWRSGIVCTLLKGLYEKGLAKLLRSAAYFKELGDVRKETLATLNVGLGLRNVGLFPEARKKLAYVVEIGKNLGVFAELAQANVFLAMIDSLEGKLEDALNLCLRAQDFCNKTDVKWVQGIVYGTFLEIYVKLNDMKLADKYFEKVENLPQEISSSYMNRHQIPIDKAIYFAARSRWEEWDHVLGNVSEISERSKNRTHFLKIRIGELVADYFRKQGKFEEAKEQSNMLKNLREQVEEMFGHVNVQLSMMVSEVVHVEKEFEMRIDLVNVGRKSGALVKIEGVALQEFQFSQLPLFCSLQNGSIVAKNKSVGPFEVETIKLKVSATKAGSYNLNPEVFYLDDLGNTKTFKINPTKITVEPNKPAFKTLTGRIPTGTLELDKLLLGGIPKKYAVVLSASPSDEREKLIKRFIETGASNHEPTIYLTCAAANAEELIRTLQNNFYVVVCNSQADSALPNLSNIIKLRGLENLTDIDIALTKLFRTIDSSTNVSKRICMDLLSDILLQHHAVTTRRWLSALIAFLKTKNSTTLAIIDPNMHASEDIHAISGLFDGEIKIAERSGEGFLKILKVERLHNQDYQKESSTMG